MIVIISIQPFHSHHISELLLPGMFTTCTFLTAQIGEGRCLVVSMSFFEKRITLPETHGFSHLKMDGWNTIVSFRGKQPIFRCLLLLVSGSVDVCMFFFVPILFFFVLDVFLFSFQASTKRLFMFSVFLPLKIKNRPPLGVFFVIFKI